MKRQDLFVSVATAMLTLGICLPLMAETAMAQATQTQNLTPAQKAAIEALKKKKALQQAAPKVVPKPAPKVVQPKIVPKAAVTVQKKLPPKPIAKPFVKTPPPPVVNKTVKPVTPPVANDPRKLHKPFVRTAPSVTGRPVSPVNQPKSTNPAFPTPNQKQYNPGLPSVQAGKPQPGTKPLPVSRPANLEALKTQRKQIVAKRGNAVIIKEPDQRTIVKKGGKSVIVHNEANRLKRVAPNAKSLKQGRNNVTVIQRNNNVQIFNVTDSNGQLLRRYRRDGDGRETVLIDNESRRHKSRWGRNLAIGLGVGAGIIAGAAILNAVADVPPPRVDIPRRQYVVDYEDANDDDVYEAFSAPPVDRIERRYTLDEVRATPALRDRMRRVDLNDITFETGSFDVSESQYPKLERVARALKRVIDKDPNEVFMIEGYTDAVGEPDDNLSLSDRRAESVAVILSEQFQVPAENITTQGYGEQYLKLPTNGPERANRRVAVRRITPLLSQGERRPEPREEPMVEQPDDQAPGSDEQYDDRQDQRDDRR